MSTQFNPTFSIPVPEWKSPWRIEQEAARASEAYWKNRPLPKPVVAPPPIKVEHLPGPRKRQPKPRIAMRNCAGPGCAKMINSANQSGFCKTCWTADMLDRTYGVKMTCKDCGKDIGRRPNASYCKPCGKTHTNRKYKRRKRAENAASAE